LLLPDLHLQTLPNYLKYATWHSRPGVDTLNKAACALTKKVIAKGHFVVAIVVRVIYSILLIFLALYISNSTPEERDSLCAGV
jgi:hypothetical protein